MSRRRIILTSALAATLALPAAAGAADGSEPPCLRSDARDKREIQYALAGGVLTLTPREAGEVLRVKTSKRGTVDVTRRGNAYAFDVEGVEGETFTVVRERDRRGKLQLRIRVAEAGGDAITRFEVKVKAYDTVACRPDADDDDRATEAHGKDRGDERSGGRGRGRETDAERDARKDRDDG